MDSITWCVKLSGLNPISRSVLNVGCGNLQTGTVNCDVSRIDPAGHRHGVKIVRNRCFVLCDAQHLPFPPSSFDIVESKQLIEHLEYPESAIREMIRVSREVIHITSFHRLSNKLQLNRRVRQWFREHHIANIDFSWLYSIAEKYGCVVVDHRVYSTVGLPFDYFPLIQIPAEIGITFVKSV